MRTSTIVDVRRLNVKSLSAVIQFTVALYAQFSFTCGYEVVNFVGVFSHLQCLDESLFV